MIHSIAIKPYIKSQNFQGKNLSNKNGNDSYIMARKKYDNCLKVSTGLTALWGGLYLAFPSAKKEFGILFLGQAIGTLMATSFRPKKENYIQSINKSQKF